MPAARTPLRPKPKTEPATPLPSTGDVKPAPKRRVAADPAKRVAALRNVLFDTIEKEVEEGNVRVILWLADRLRLLDVTEEQRGPAEELRTLLESLPAAELKEFASLAGH